MAAKKIKKQKTSGNEDIDGSVESYKASAKSECEFLALQVMSKRILDLHIILQSDRFNPRNWSENHSEVNIAIPDQQSGQTSGGIDGSDGWLAFRFPNGLVKANSHLVDSIAILKPMALQLMKDMNSMRIGVSLMIPKIEDGNNFGVAIQHEILIGLTAVEIHVQSQLDYISEYFTKRADIVTKIARYPHCLDFRQALTQIDHNYYLILCFFAVDLYNQYIKIQDMFVKNLKKIKEPRTSDNVHMLY